MFISKNMSEKISLINIRFENKVQKISNQLKILITK